MNGYRNKKEYYKCLITGCTNDTRGTIYCGDCWKKIDDKITERQNQPINNLDEERGKKSINELETSLRYNQKRLSNLTKTGDQKKIDKVRTRIELLEEEIAKKRNKFKDKRKYK